MSDQDVTRSLDQLEWLLDAPLDAPNGEAFAQWNAAFRAAAAGAGRGPEWPQVLARARVLCRRLKHRETLIRADQAGTKQEMARIGSGRRALSAYGTP